MRLHNKPLFQKKIGSSLNLGPSPQLGTFTEALLPVIILDVVQEEACAQVTTAQPSKVKECWDTIYLYKIHYKLVCLTEAP